MNVYDFDKTICKGDTESDFFKYGLFHYPKNLLRIFSYLNAYFKCKRKKISREEYRNRTYLSFKIKDLDNAIDKFWKKRKKKILKWYLSQQREDDLIISVTPEFLLTPIFKELHIKNYICSQVDLNTMKVIGKLYYSEEKVKHYLEKYSKDELDNFYTDSLLDLPMLKLAKKGYLVVNYKVTDFVIDKY